MNKSDQIENKQDEVDDFWEKQEPAKPRIHKGPGDSTCVSCEG